MFWKSAHKKYSSVNREDHDVQEYLKVCDKIQDRGYEGILGLIQNMGHQWIAKQKKFSPILEIGFGLGAHGCFEKNSSRGYYVCEYQEKYTHSQSWKIFAGKGIVTDARYLPYRNESFQTVISMYNLEHINHPDLVFEEVYRVLVSRGRFLLSIPCEGGFAWNVGRELTTRRIFMRKYGINYDKIIAFEHVSDFKTLLREIKMCNLFTIRRVHMLPFVIPNYHVNLLACFECEKRT